MKEEVQCKLVFEQLKGEIYKSWIQKDNIWIRVRIDGCSICDVFKIDFLEETEDSILIMYEDIEINLILSKIDKITYTEDIEGHLYSIYTNSGAIISISI